MKILRTVFILQMCGLSLLQAQDVAPSSPLPPAVDASVEAAPSEAPTESPPAAPVVEAEAVIPTTYDISRYESTWDKNPFLLKTVAPTQPTVSWVQDYVLAGMFNNKGKVRVSIRNKQTNEIKHISSEAKADAEFRLVKANFNRNRNEASAVIAKGAEQAEVKYDETSGAQAVTINNTMKPQGSPGAPGSPGLPQAGGAPGTVGGGMNRPGQPQLNKPGTTSPNGRVFNAPGSSGGVAAQPGNPGYVPGANISGGNVISQPGIVQPAIPTAPGTTPPVISRRRQLIPAPVIPAQP